MSSSFFGRAITTAAILGLMISGMPSVASAKMLRPYYPHGQGYGAPHARHLGGAAAAGLALGAVGLAAGAAAAHRYENGYDNDYYAPSYGYDPEEDAPY